MSLTEHQTLNTGAPVFDIEYRWFAGPAYAVLATNGVRAVFTTWTGPDTSLPGTWTEITEKVSFAGRLTRTMSGAVVDWNLDVRGTNYDATLLAEGNALACWQRIYRPTGTESAPAGWQAWTLRCVGMLSRRQDRDNWQHGHAWQATLVSHARLLRSINAPRLTAGKIRLTDGASVTASTELTQTSYEADQGEFTGGSADVSAANVVDGDRNTLYISNAVPTATTPAMPADANYPRIWEILLKPLAGWSPTTSWWVEYIGGLAKIEAVLGSYSGGTYYYIPLFGNQTNWPQPTFNRFNIICANRQLYDLYNGAGNGGVGTIIDLSEYTTLPPNWLTDGMIRLFTRGTYTSGSAQSTLAWSANGASRHYEGDGTTYWDGATLNTSTMVAGQSCMYDGSGSVQDPANWANNANPSPGANSLGVDAVWLKVELADNECYTLNAVSAATTTIQLGNYRGWVPTINGSQGVISSKVFNWTSRDADGLHGVSWVNAPSAPIPIGTRCYPYSNSLAQTGYPVTATHFRRRKQPAIQHYKVYWSPYGGIRNFEQSGWASDYYTTFHEVQENTQSLLLTDNLAEVLSDRGGDEVSTPFKWVRSYMYVIYAMTDSGRAKVNETEADLSQRALDALGTLTLDSTESWGLAKYLFETWCGFPTEDFAQHAGVSGHALGTHALAVTPVDRVLASLAAATGCLVEYDVTGGVTWRPDPWWPYNVPPAPQAYTPPVPVFYTFAAAGIRGEVSSALDTPNVEYVILNAVSMDDGDPHTVRYVYPQPYGLLEPPVAAMVTEISDKILARDADAPLVAQTELERMLAGSRTATLTVKGPGEWCEAGQRLGLTWDLDNDGTAETTDWLIEQMTTTTEQRSGQKALRTELSLRGFR